MTQKCLWQEDQQIARKEETGVDDIAVTGLQVHLQHFLLPPGNCSSSANPALCLKCAENHGFVELVRLEKTFKIIGSNH